MNNDEQILSPVNEELVVKGEKKWPDQITEGILSPTLVKGEENDE